MDCERFARWLDDGMPESDRAWPAGAIEARAHATACERCRAALAVARDLDAALEWAPATAPAGFAARVMERVARARAARFAVLAEADAFPWWVRVAAEPAAAIALALAALVLWQRAALVRLSDATLHALGSPAVGSILNRIAEPRLTLDLSAFANPFLLTGVMLAMLPLAWWVGLAVYHWSGDARPARAAGH